jgi:hypothetical protein
MLYKKCSLPKKKIFRILGDLVLMLGKKCNSYSDCQKYVQFGFSQTKAVVRTLSAPLTYENRYVIFFRAFASAHIRPKWQTKPNIPPLSERYFDKRSNPVTF